MRVFRFYQPTLLAQGLITLTQETHHHVHHVLRLKVNTELQLFDGAGDEWAGRIIDTQKKQTQVELTHAIHNDCPIESSLPLHLAQAITRKDTMDIALQKAVELGVSTITPVLTEFSDVKQDERYLEKKSAHWQQIIIQACEQCGRNHLPRLSPVISLMDWCGQLADDVLKLVADPRAPGIAKLSTLESNQPMPKGITIVIGPEGGFSTKEIDALVRKSFQAIRLGPRILRLETATIAALALIQHLWGDLT